MATIKEDYCSKEIYRLLIEKGFDGEVHTTFDKEGYTQTSITLQMAMKWLREVHCIWISVFYGLGNTKKDKRFVKWEWEVYNIIDDSLLGHTKSKEECCNTYEEAAEAALKYSLENLI